MSGRPRTTSFAESCKPVQQPSAFGSMKVSSEYWFPSSVLFTPALPKRSMWFLYLRIFYFLVSIRSALSDPYCLFSSLLLFFFSPPITWLGLSYGFHLGREKKSSLAFQYILSVFHGMLPQVFILQWQNSVHIILYFLKIGFWRGIWNYVFHSCHKLLND